MPGGKLAIYSTMSLLKGMVLKYHPVAQKSTVAMRRIRKRQSVKPALQGRPTLDWCSAALKCHLCSGKDQVARRSQDF